MSRDATCAISRTGIKADEDLVLAVVFKEKEWNKDLDLLLNSLANHIRQPDLFSSPLQYVGLVIPEDWGYVFGCDYILEDDDRDDEDWDLYQFLAHKEMAEALIHRHLNPHNLEQDVLDILKTANRLRINLYGVRDLGCQFVELEEMIEQHRFNRKINHFLKDRIRLEERKLKSEKE